MVYNATREKSGYLAHQLSEIERMNQVATMTIIGVFLFSESF